VKDYLGERGYFVTERRHPLHNGAADLTRISVTGQRELT
jgi:hypothetical protein